SAPPPLVCPSPLPPRMDSERMAELRRQMSTAPPPSEERETPSARKKVRHSLREDDVGSKRIALSAKHIPRLAKGKRDLSTAPIDPKDAFLLSQIDGMLTVDDLADLT